MAKKSFAMGIVVGAIALASILLLAASTLPITGIYNVSAMRDHTSFTRWFLDSTFKHSVLSRAENIEAPSNFSKDMVRAGASSYKSMCQHCHGGSGIERESWAKGLLPEPPELTEAAAHWKPRELFWIVKNGVKMSGMPAFGEDHSDEQIWNIVGFVDALPGMTKEKFQSYEEQRKNSSTHSH